MKKKFALMACAASVSAAALSMGVFAEESTEVKTGLAVYGDVSGSADASADADGTGASDTMIAAVTVDEEGKIVDCAIDIAQTKVSFSAEGKITADVEAEYLTKQELGEDYGMKAASAIGKEWYEQADAFAAYCVGKTAEEVAGLEVTEDGKAADEDLVSGCSISISPLQEVVVKAVENAEAAGAKASDKIGIGVDTSVSGSADASESADGKTEAYSYVTAVTVDESGVVTSAVVDAIQSGVSFDTSGVITSDISAEVESKQTLGDDYGMKAASGIGKEWYEQADAFAAYCVGKTADEISGTAVEDGLATDTDLVSSVTVHVNDFIATAVKAVNNAE